MTLKTQQKILKTLNHMLADLDHWLQGLGLSRDEIVSVYTAIAMEKGIAAGLLSAQVANVFPLAAHPGAKLENGPEELRRFLSAEYADWLLTQPEPEHEKLEEFLGQLKNAVPNLRQHYAHIVKVGPYPGRGGRPKLHDDPALREKIRAEIRDLRGPGRKLTDIFGRLALKYGSKPATMKRIWLDKPAHTKIKSF